MLACPQADILSPEFRKLAAMCLATIVATACGGGSPTAPTSASASRPTTTTSAAPPPTPVAATVSSIVLTVSGSQVSSITLNVNQSATISASVRDRSGNTMSSKTVQWLTSDANVVNGTPSGNTVTITGYRAGSATVTATVDGVSGGVPVDVRAPTSTPSPAPTSYYVWGGTNYGVYLGYFSCTFCKELGADSINNEFGTYGSQFSSQSMRNQFGTYGSQFNSLSPCNPYTSSAPRVYNSDRSVFYGVLGGSPYASGYLSSLAGWVSGYLCNH